MLWHLMLCFISYKFNGVGFCGAHYCQRNSDFLLTPVYTGNTCPWEVRTGFISLPKISYLVQWYYLFYYGPHPGWNDLPTLKINNISVSNNQICAVIDHKVRALILPSSIWYRPEVRRWNPTTLWGFLQPYVHSVLSQNFCSNYRVFHS